MCSSSGDFRAVTVDFRAHVSFFLYKSKVARLRGDKKNVTSRLKKKNPQLLWKGQKVFRKEKEEWRLRS